MKAPAEPFGIMFDELKLKRFEWAFLLLLDSEILQRSLLLLV